MKNKATVVGAKGLAEYNKPGSYQEYATRLSVDRQALMQAKEREKKLLRRRIIKPVRLNATTIVITSPRNISLYE